MKLVFKPLRNPWPDIFRRFRNFRKRYVCEKGNIKGREEDVDKVCSEVQKNFWKCTGKWRSF